MTDKELAEVLDQWFVDHRRDTRYNSNPVWKVLKYRLYMAIVTGKQIGRAHV